MEQINLQEPLKSSNWAIGELNKWCLVYLYATSDEKQQKEERGDCVARRRTSPETTEAKTYSCGF